MRVISEIRERLEQNTHQRRDIGRNGYTVSRLDEIQMEYLNIEAKALNDMLSQVQQRRWALLKSKKFLYFLSIVSMSAYVIGMFYMFKEMDLSRVEQWQFALTALPFCLIIVVVPMALIALLTNRKTS